MNWHFKTGGTYYYLYGNQVFLVLEHLNCYVDGLDIGEDIIAMLPSGRIMRVGLLPNFFQEAPWENPK